MNGLLAAGRLVGLMVSSQGVLQMCFLSLAAVPLFIAFLAFRKTAKHESSLQKLHAPKVSGAAMNYLIAQFSKDWASTRE